MTPTAISKMPFADMIIHISCIFQIFRKELNWIPKPVVFSWALLKI